MATATIFWLLFWVQLGGMLSLLAFRLSLSVCGEKVHWLCQGLFYASLGLVGGATVFALAHEASCWVCPAISLGVLTIGAVCEPARAEIAS